MIPKRVSIFFLFPLIIIAGSIDVWLIASLAGGSGITRIMPLVVFIILSGGFVVISMMRAIKTWKKQIYFNATLSFVLFALLATCVIIHFIYFINS
jgi:hypothetical protein